MKSVINTTTIMKAITKNLCLLILSLILAFGFGLTACEGPAGPQGEQGSQGEVGPIGPAGEDGSIMHAGDGAPTENIGSEGDYYLNQSTGELYGPKDTDGWGEPIIVLMGDNGEDGKDGSQIYSGTEDPPGSLGKAGDFYLDTDDYLLYGPKLVIDPPGPAPPAPTWGSPINLKGAEGNANVTRYIFPGFEFDGTDLVGLTTVQNIPNIESEAEMQESAWLVYIVNEISSGRNVYYGLSGYGAGGDSRYRTYHSYFPSGNDVRFLVELEDGPGETYEQIEIVRIEASNTEDLTSVGGSIIPDALDTSDYEAVAEHFGFGNTTGPKINRE